MTRDARKSLSRRINRRSRLRIARSPNDSRKLLDNALPCDTDTDNESLIRSHCYFVGGRVIGHGGDMRAWDRSVLCWLWLGCRLAAWIERHCCRRRCRRWRRRRVRIYDPHSQRWLWGVAGAASSGILWVPIGIAIDRASAACRISHEYVNVSTAETRRVICEVRRRSSRRHESGHNNLVPHCYTHELCRSAQK
jgi:hypothetical protein